MEEELCSEVDITKSNNLVSVSNNEEAFFSQKEEEELIDRALSLMEKQAQRINGCDSSSVSYEKAQNLLESILFTFNFLLEEGYSKDALLTGNMDKMLAKGQRLLEQRKTNLENEYMDLCASLPGVRNVYFSDTVKNLAGFFKYYDFRYAAQEIPCEIDYWLLYQVSEERKGICFMEEYIRRLKIENDFLKEFEEEKIRVLYKKTVPSYVNSLFNLCDQPLNNAIGKTMLGENVKELSINQEGRDFLLTNLYGKSLDEIQGFISKAIGMVCQKTGLHKDYEILYFEKAGEGIGNRIFEAVKVKDLSNIFVDFVCE